ncbi:MAG TPA: Holliday junction resolvase RuvX [Opitutaceae bacterium]|jgi:putative Holliday junction resolvase|nr:Holliday junction resolvase RuvX [Opitutaceae bacterium]
MRCLGIDYGEKRIGLSYGDALGVAVPMPALTSATAEKRQLALAALVRARNITDFVLGLPLNMDGSTGPKAKEVEAFAAQLRADFGLPVHFVDERLTSYEAEETIPKSRRRAVRASGLIDSRAATLILQDFLDQKFPHSTMEE